MQGRLSLRIRNKQITEQCVYNFIPTDRSEIQLQRFLGNEGEILQLQANWVVCVCAQPHSTILFT